jgi:hypothetical protein
MKLRLQAAVPQLVYPPIHTRDQEKALRIYLQQLSEKLPSMTPEQVNNLDWALYDAGFGPKPKCFRDGSPDMTRNSSVKRQSARPRIKVLGDYESTDTATAGLQKLKDRLRVKPGFTYQIFDLQPNTPHVLLVQWTEGGSFTSEDVENAVQDFFYRDLENGDMDDDELFTVASETQDKLRELGVSVTEVD